MSVVTLPGYPRIGQDRELKRATERYWKDPSAAPELLETGRRLRERHWRRQAELGVDLLPVGDFSLYDTMLDAAALFGSVPARYSKLGPPGSPAAYFAMARGTGTLSALEMTKWFDTNYHYIVPEVDGHFSLHPESLLDQVRETRALSFEAKPVLPGPYTFLRLAKLAEGLDLTTALKNLSPLYRELLARLSAAGARTVSLDEPALVLDDAPPAEALLEAYKVLGAARGDLKLIVQTYFEDLGRNRELALRLPVDGIGLDLVRGPEQWKLIETPGGFPKNWIVVAGVVDGRNVWRSDLTDLLARLSRARAVHGDRLWIGPSCSLMHLPYRVGAEPVLDPEIRSWICFAEERLQELQILKRGLAEGPAAVAADLAENRRILETRERSTRVRNPVVRDRLRRVDDAQFEREPYPERRRAQAGVIPLPALPTTTIGSFPQTAEVRSARQRFRSGKIERAEYETFVDGKIREVIQLQEEIGLDVLVHGEFERADMVDYFAERLEGMLATQTGWVQSYGTRYVRPPLIYGDVSRSGPMTVRESRFAQSLTTRPVKGMLTGPVTILNWSFARADLPREEVALQIACCLRDESVDLETAGIRIVQIDEPAFREGLPLRGEERDTYLQWAVRAFRLASSGVRAATQIHTHMCYSNFNEILSMIADMDADVLSVESSRSSGDLLRAFDDYKYPRGIGPGVYDVHSERIVPADEMADLLERSGRLLPHDILWVNPDCGLKTRGYEEVIPTLRNMVEAAHRVRDVWKKGETKSGAPSVSTRNT